MTTLVVAAHPDDEVLGCGGTMARLAAAGEEVHVAILGEGVTSRWADRDAGDRDDVAALAEESRRAGQVLGVRSSRWAGLPDNRFDTVALLDVVKTVEDLIADVSPTVVYAQHGGDVNVDHQIVFRAVLTATRPVPGQPVRELYAFEVGSSTEWSFQHFSPVFRANTFVDISSTIETKVEAMLAYRSEVRPFPHPRSPEALRAAAARWGSVAGVHRAEAFELIRLVR